MLVPLWDLSQKLRNLYVTVPEEDFGDDLNHETKEQLEADLAAPQEPPSPVILDRDAREEYYTSVVCRAIVAAVRGGKLRVLGHDGSLQRPYAARSLLPFWVQIEDWSVDAFEWLAAARALRLLLAHTSYALEQEIQSGRQLTRQNVQALLDYFKAHKGLRNVTRARHEDSQYVERYLAWLTEDDELAQQVVDAWNAVVKRGEAGVVECSCDACPGTVEPEDEESGEEDSDAESFGGSWSGSDE